MSDQNLPRAPRRTLVLLGTALGLVLAGGTAVALVSGLAIADQPGKSLPIPPVVVTVGDAEPPTDPNLPSDPTLTPVPTPAKTDVPAPQPEPAPAGPELVPAPAPVIVDDQGGNRPGQAGNSGTGSGGGDDDNDDGDDGDD